MTPSIKAFSVVRVGRHVCEVLAITTGGVKVQIKQGKMKGVVFTARFEDVR